MLDVARFNMINQHHSALMRGFERYFDLLTKNSLINWFPDQNVVVINLENLYADNGA